MGKYALLLVVAIAVLVGCRTRLPVDTVGTVAPEQPPLVASQDAPAPAPGVAARWLDAMNPEAEAPDGRSRYHLEITPDRLRDLVRPVVDTGRRSGFGAFFFESSVCLPHR